MKSTQKARYFILGVVTTLIVSTTVMPALAANISKQLTAYYRDIKLVVDGVPVEPKDSAGNVVEPFVADGTTYLPVRALAEALGKTVEWDGETSTVYVGKRPGSVQYLLDVLKPYSTAGRGYIEFDYSTSDDIGWYESITMGGIKYHKGFKLGTNPTGYAVFNLNGQYSEITAMLGIDDSFDRGDATVEIWKDGVLSETISTETQTLPRKIIIDVTGVLQLKITAPTTVSDIAFGEVTIE